MHEAIQSSLNNFRIAHFARGDDVQVPFFDEAKLIHRVTHDASDNISYQPDFKKCAARVEKVTA